jgi:hypothetical protein
LHTTVVVIDVFNNCKIRSPRGRSASTSFPVTVRDGIVYLTTATPLEIWTRGLRNLLTSIDSLSDEAGNVQSRKLYLAYIHYINTAY